MFEDSYVHRWVFFLLLVFLVAALFSLGGCEPESESLSGRELLENIPDLDPNAIVLLAYLGSFQRGGTIEWPKTAFAIGDGTLILTAAHCVESFDDPRKQAVSPEILVFSPYYGDIFDFQVAALDKDADLAILKARWTSHPAFSLASLEQLEAEEKIIIASRPCRPSISGKNKITFRLSRQLNAEKLPVGTSNRSGPDEAIVLKGTRLVSKGWSGSALLLPGNGKVVGVLNKLRTIKSAKKGSVVRKDALGCDTRSIESLLKKHSCLSKAKSSTTRLPPIEDADKAFDIAVEYLQAYLNSDLTAAVNSAEKLVTLRPDSAHARLFLASSAFQKYAVETSTDELLELAEENFEQARDLKPDSANIHTCYGNFLKERKKYQQALQETEAALEIEPDNQLALANRINIFMVTDPNRAEDLARKLVQRDPNNPHWLYWYYQALAKLGQYEKGLQAAQKAVKLNPGGLYNGALAEALEKRKRIDEAEPHYKIMTEKCGCQKCWYDYANFLLHHRPEKLEEAEKAIDAAEEKKARRIPQEKIKYLRLRLLEKKKNPKSLKLSPGNSWRTHREMRITGIDLPEF